MNGISHKQITRRSIEILAELGKIISAQLSENIFNLEEATAAVDKKQDLEFIDVDFGLDDPHIDEASADDDNAKYEYSGKFYTAFNHFIDIKKGTGIYDDYDGYSYYYGSASKDEHQDGDELVTGAESIFATLSGKKVDEGINWWFDDEYVHAPGHQWYRNCSPSLSRYSFYQDKGKYSSALEEIADRFKQEKRKGVPYSVFMPVDNMARFWYSQYLINQDYEEFSYVMHAIQDAAVPHHSAGYMGNWHVEYEKVLETKLPQWLQTNDFIFDAKKLVKKWIWQDPHPPTQLKLSDRIRIPAINWRIDMLVTWLAINAYYDYDKTYNHFRLFLPNGESNLYSFPFGALIPLSTHDEAMKKLTVKALAMSAFVLLKVSMDTNPIPVILLYEALSSVHTF